jgi:putative phosphoesterase
MKKIGLISDTHGHFDDKLKDFFAPCAEIWHAGDVGNAQVINELEKICPVVKGVFGNIDGTEVRQRFQEDLRFLCENLEVWITHIGGYPGKYDRRVKTKMHENPPKLFIAGHSHILKVIFDQKLECLHINPGAYGLEGFHVVRTAMRFDVDCAQVKNLEILEIPRR